jgi:hypothetical protein
VADFISLNQATQLEFTPWIAKLYDLSLRSHVWGAKGGKNLKIPTFKKD